MPAQHTEFDVMMQRFTSRVRFAADWKDNYFGAAYSTRIKQAISDLKSAIAEAELNREIKPEQPGAYRRNVTEKSK